MKALDFWNSIKKILALILMGLISTSSSTVILAVEQPVSAPITIPVPIPVPQAPEMVYPRNGQTLDLEGAYMFKVRPVEGASGYLFGLFQDGQMVYENYRDTRTLSSNGEFALRENNPAHAKFHAGNVKVMIRAYVRNQWTDAHTITITLKPRVSLPVPTASPSATPNPTPIGIGNTNPIQRIAVVSPTKTPAVTKPTTKQVLPIWRRFFNTFFYRFFYR